MSNINASTRKASSDAWTSTQAYIMAVICLLIGLAVGYLLRGSAGPAETQANLGAAAMPGAGAAAPTPEQLKQMADTTAAPLLERLKSAPNDASLLGQIGDIYYDVHQYPTAVDYYSRSLKIDPKNVSVRTDMGTAYFYLGDADRALSEFATSLKYNPNHGQSLFNVGMVKWQGKMDAKGAIAAWEELLAKNPDYPEKDKVKQLITQASKHINLPPGARPQ